jgi:drug/metabolite transporter (DMT)-like permease
MVQFISLVFVIGASKGVDMPVRDRLLAVLVAARWGANFLAIHVGLAHFPPLFLAALRFAVVAVPTVLLVPRPRVRLRWLLGYGLGFGTVQFLFLFVAMDVGMPTGLASLVLQASAPFTVLLGAVLLRERISGRQGAGIALAVLGLLAIAVARAQTAALLPMLLTLVATLGWALGNLASRLAAPPNPLHFTLWMSVVPPVPLFAASWVVEGPGTGWEALRAAFTPAGVPGLLAVAYIAVLATVVGAGIWTALLRRHPAGVVAPYSLLVPVVGMGLAALVLSERPSPVELVAAAVIVGGVLLGTPRPVAQRPALVASRDHDAEFALADRLAGPNVATRVDERSDSRGRT